MKRKFGKLTATVMAFIMLFSPHAVNALAVEVPALPSAESYVTIVPQSNETEPAAEASTVTINIKDISNGAILAQSSIELKYNSGSLNINLLKSINNYQFANISSDGTFFSPAVGNSVSYARPEKMPEQVNLDVFLSRKGLTLSYSPNAFAEEVTGMPESLQVSKEPDQSGKAVFDVSAATPKREGYHFLGWSTDAAATEPQYVASAKIELSENGTLYAVWKEKTESPEKPETPETPAPENPDNKPEVLWQTLSYDLNGGAGTINQDFQPMGGEFTVNGVIPTRDGYSFVKWVTNLDNIDENIKPGDKLPANTSIVLHAVWKENELKTYKINYSTDGGKNTPEPQSAESRTGSVKIKLSDKVPKKDKMVFLGWALNKGGEVVLQPGETAIVNDNYQEITLHAVWVHRSDSPKTADMGGIYFWACLGVLSLTGVAVSAGTLKKKEY